MLLKIGAYANFGDLTAGINVTTPTLKVAGNGDFGYTSSFNSPDSVGLATAYQEKVPVTYKSPFAVGVGVGYRFNRVRLHISAEWFAAIQPYSVFEITPFEAQVPAGTVIAPEGIQEQQSVVNLGVGIEYAFAGNVIGYCSYFIDRSSLSDNPETSALSISPADINNLTVGSEFTVLNFRLQHGAGYRWGQSETRELSEILAGLGGPEEVLYNYSGIRFFFGIEAGIGN